MRRAGTAVASLLIATVLLGCPLLKKKKADAGDEDDDNELSSLADAATVAVSGTGAKNEADILRYANEVPLDNVPAVIGKDGVKVRNFPGNGPVVTTLSKGTPVAQIAKYFSTAVLIMFDDPSDDGSKLMGWVIPGAFDVAAPPPTKTVFVPPRKVDASAPTPPKDAGGPTPTPTSPTVKDAGAPPPTVKDAGAPPPTVKDAGGGSSNSATIPTPPRGIVAVAPVNGQCPTGWKIVSSMCRRPCNADADCGRQNVFCVTKSGVKHCSSEK